MTKVFLYLFLTVVLLPLTQLFAEVEKQQSEPEVLKIGYIGSLSNFAANYGQAVLEGVQLAVEEAAEDGRRIELIVEDDQSVTKNTVSSYKKLMSQDQIAGLITGSWWATALVKIAERDRIPFISCETNFEDKKNLAPNYFIMQGKLRDWIRVYEPLLKQKGYKRGAIIHFVSNFGHVLADQMKISFSTKGREFLGSFKYTDIQAQDSAASIVKLKSLDPDILYLDAQPASLNTLLKRIEELKFESLTVLTNAVADDANRQGLIPSNHPNMFYTKRKPHKKEFADKFTAKFGRQPYLNADLGYYAAHLLIKAASTKNAVGALKSGELEVDGIPFHFDKHNVFTGAPQEIWKLDGNTAHRVITSP